MPPAVLCQAAAFIVGGRREVDAIVLTMLVLMMNFDVLVLMACVSGMVEFWLVVLYSREVKSESCRVLLEMML